MTRPRLAPAVKALAAVSLFNDVASEMVYPLLPALVTVGLGAGPATLGALDGASDLAASALRWWSGRLADRPRTRTALVGGGYLLAVLVRPVLAFAERAWQVIGLRVVDRIGKGLRSPARDAMIADLTETPMLGRAFGLHRSADHLGAVLGSLVAFELLRRGWAVREVIGASLVPGIVALLTLGIALGLAHRAEPEPGPAAGPKPASTAARRLGWLAAVAACRLPETLLLYRLQQLGAPIAAIPLLWAVLHIVRSVSSYPAGVVADRLGVRPALMVGGLLHAVVLVAMGFASGPSLAIAAFLALGFVAGLSEPAERSAIARLFPDRRGAAFGRFQALSGVGALVAGVGFGWLYQQVGAGAAFLAAAAASGLVVAGWYLTDRRMAA